MRRYSMYVGLWDPPDVDVSVDHVGIYFYFTILAVGRRIVASLIKVSKQKTSQSRRKAEIPVTRQFVGASSPMGDFFEKNKKKYASGEYVY